MDVKTSLLAAAACCCVVDVKIGKFCIGNVHATFHCNFATDKSPTNLRQLGIAIDVQLHITSLSIFLGGLLILENLQVP